MYSNQPKGKAFLRKHHTSGDLTGLWNSSGSNSSLKNNWDDSFWASKTNSSRWSPSVHSSSSTFDEVESLNFSRSSNDSHQPSWDRSPGGRLFGRGNGVFAGGTRDGGSRGGGGDGGMQGVAGGYGDLPKRYLSRQSSTTSASTSPSSGNFGSSDTSHSSHKESSKNMALSKILGEFIEALGSQCNVEPTDKIHLCKLTQQIREWNGRTNGEIARGDAPKKSIDSFPSWGENDTSCNGVRFRDFQDSEDMKSNSSGQYSLSEQPRRVRTMNVQRKRRKDLIIPDDDDNTTTNDRKNDISSKNRTLNEAGPVEMKKSSFKKQSKEKSHNERNRVDSNSCLVSTDFPRSGRGVLIPSASLHKSGSLDSNASQPDAFNPLVRPFSTSHAERVLMGLGFGGKEGFLPERFLRDWYSKLSAAQTKDYQPTMESRGKSNDKESDLDNDKTSKEDATTPNIHRSNEKNQRPNLPVRQDSFSSSQLDEASNFPPRSGGSEAKKQQITEFLSALSTNTDSDTRAMRVKMFANSRQKSLPLHLETLSEEDEKNARVPGIDPFDKEAKLQMFISDVMSSSGKSTCSNSDSSVPSSNTSDTQSSSSDGRSVFKTHDIRRTRVGRNVGCEKSLSNPLNKFSNLAKDLQKGSGRTSQKSPKSSHRSLNQLIRQEMRTSHFDKKSSTDKEIHFSTDSLEVADIMKYDETTASTTKVSPNHSEEPRHPLLKNVEPAMVSIILEDVDEGKSDCNNKHEFSRLESGRLSIPSSGSSMSLSPIPQSPVTVIEVALDNTQDSLDTEDGNNSSRDNDDFSPRLLRQSGVVSCTNCGSAVLVVQSKPLPNINDDDTRLGENGYPQENDNSANRRYEPNVQESPLDISRTSLTASWVSASDGTSSSNCSEKTKRHRESFVVRNRSPNFYSRKRSTDWANKSPCQSPSISKQGKGPDSETCNITDHSSRSPLSPVSVVSENVHRRNWIDPSDLVNTQHDSAYHNKSSCHCCQCLNVCEFHHSEYHHHHHHHHHHHQHNHHPCMHQTTCCGYRPYPPHHSPNHDTTLGLPDCQPNSSAIIAHSSPGSAFKSPRKDNKTLCPVTDDNNERSDPDQEGCSPIVAFSLDPLPSGANSINRLKSSSVSKEGGISTHESSHHKSTPLIFSKENYSKLNNSQLPKGKVQQISRAVQVCLPNGNAEMSDMSYSGNCYLACDREVQCSLGGTNNGSVIHFNKCVQTKIPSYEISCQTMDILDNHTELTHEKCTSKSVNTVICLIGDEHNVSGYDTHISNNSKSVRSNGCEFRFVDETLDLIESELNAIDLNKQENLLLNTRHHNISLWNAAPSSFVNLAPSLSTTHEVNLEHTEHDACLRNPFVSGDSTQASPCYQDKHNSYSCNNSFQDAITGQGDSSAVDQNTQKESLCSPQIQNYDLEKEMSAYLRPCQGIYWDVRTPEFLRSSPNDLTHSTLYGPGTLSNDIALLSTSGLWTNKQAEPVPVSFDAVQNINQNSDFRETLHNSYNNIVEEKNKIIPDKMKSQSRSPANRRSGKCLSDIRAYCASVLQKDFLQVPSSPHEHILKSRYPSFDMSSPSSTKSAPTRASVPPLCIEQTRPTKSFSLEDIQKSARTKLKFPLREKEPLSKLGYEWNQDTVTHRDRIDNNSEQSEVPMSSSRDSLTEVSVLSSLEGPSHTLSFPYLHTEISSDSNLNDEGDFDTFVFPVGIELSLSCPHSNWEGVYGHNKDGRNQIDKLFPYQTKESSKFTTIPSVDALSDKSVAGSEIAQDIDDIEVMLSESRLPRSDSGSSYSDVQNNSLGDMSDDSTSSLKDELEPGVHFLTAGGESYDLLQVSDCGEGSPSINKPNPCACKQEGMGNVFGTTQANFNHEPNANERKSLHVVENTTIPFVIDTIDGLGNKEEREELIKDESKEMLTVNDSQGDANGFTSHEMDRLKTIQLSSSTNDNVLTYDTLCQDEIFETSKDSDCRNFKDENCVSCENAIYSGETSGKDPPKSGNGLGKKRLLPTKSDPVDKEYTWWPKIVSPDRPGDRVENRNDDGEHPVLRTFQCAQFDSLLNQATGDDMTPVLLQPDKAASHFEDCLDTHKLSEMEFPNAHVLSVQTEDGAENKRSVDTGCSFEECNIMDELEIIALFKNMENLSDFVDDGFGTQIPSPYPLSEIPEEDTQSEESITIESTSVFGRMMAQETQESVIDCNFLEMRRCEVEDLTDDSTNPCDSMEGVGDGGINTNHGGDKGINAKSLKNDFDKQRLLNTDSCSSSWYRDHHSRNSFNGQNTDPPVDIRSTKQSETSQSPKPTIEKRIFKEERTFNTNCVYTSGSKSETSQITILNINAKTIPTPSTTTPTSTDDGHLSTIALTVGDYRERKFNNNKDFNENSPSESDEPVKKNISIFEGAGGNVKTMYSRLISDESSKIIISNREHNNHASDNLIVESSPRKHSPTPKRLRSRDSLLRLHEQKKFTGSDSDSDVNATQQNHDGGVSEKGDAVVDSPVDGDSGNISDNGKDCSLSSEDEPFFKTSKNTEQEPYNQTPSLSIDTGITGPQTGSQAIRNTNLKPRVIIQQPSDDIPSWEMEWRNSSSLRNNPEPTDQLLPTTSKDDFSSDSLENQPSPTSSLPNVFKPKPGTHTHSSHFLSPNLAFFNEAFKEPPSPIRKDYSSSNGDSHPELSYLDLISRFNGVKESQDNHLSLPTHQTSSGYGSNQTKSSEMKVNSKLSCDEINKAFGNYTTDSRENGMHTDSGIDVAKPGGYDVETSAIPKPVEAETSPHLGSNGPYFKQRVIVDKKTPFSKGPDQYSKITSRASSDEIENNIQMSDKLANQIVIPRDLPLTTDSADSFDSRFISLTSRDSGFESRGSPIENPVLKEFQRKNTLQLSGIEFSDEMV